MRAHHEHYRRYLESLTEDSLERLHEFVSEDVCFRDPFNEAHGVEAMTRVFRHMFTQLSHVRFRVLHAAASGETCLLAWRFEARLRGRDWSFEGASVVHFDAEGKVVEHIDHWDAARDFYERLPVIGWLLRGVRGRFSVD